MRAVTMRAAGLALAVAAGLAASGCAGAAGPSGASGTLHGPSAFRFVALGDLPYGPPAQSYPPYARLIERINARAPAFSIHIGDIKSGSTPCTDELFAEQLAFMNRFASALVYTPGDNEWTDCHRPAAGRYDPRERLARLRTMFFPGPRSLGQAPIALERQSDVAPAHARYVENARFTMRGVLFVTIHVVGSNNGFETRDPAAVDEFRERDAAVIAWLRDSFAKAEREQAKGVVVAFQANPFDSKTSERDFPDHSGFARSIGDTLIPLGARFGRPVLVIHGDTHTFRVDRPFRDARRQVVRNMIRLEVFGEFDPLAVEVGVDPDAPSVFSFSPLDNPLP